MSKELEVINWLLENEMIYRGRTRLPISSELNGIKHSLQILESIDNAEPSEAMKCLHTIAFNTQFIAGMNFGNELRTIEQYILKAQEIEKENSRYKQLEEQLGCPLDFIFKVLKAPKIYIEGMNVKSEYDNKIKFHSKTNQYIISPYAINGKRPEFLFIDRWGYGYDLRLKDYKNTWWTKKDKSE